MIDLFLHGRRISTVFELLGHSGKYENDMSRSIGWGLARCPSFLQEFVAETLGQRINAQDATISLQVAESRGGVTDLEIQVPGQVHLIIEAKRGWVLPSRVQLEKYAARQSFHLGDTPLKALLALTDCSRDYARVNLECTKVGGIPVCSASWAELYRIARRARGKATLREKHLIDELTAYLKELITMQSIDSNWVYVVSLGSGTPRGWRISWIDIVNNKRRYFHPVGINRWPKVPPNYIAFRYGGKLQSIHHIEGYEVVSDLHEAISEIPAGQTDIPHFVYTLGTGFAPAHNVPTGRIYPNGRVRCMLDTLFTSKTISEARDISRRRQPEER